MVTAMDHIATFRIATVDDLPAIIALLADDAIGATREQAGHDLDPAYRRAWDDIEADPHNEVLVADADGRVVATLQLTVIPNLSRGGTRRAQIEAVRVAADLRGSGLGTAFIEWTLQRARDRGCTLAQLTSDKERGDALRFWESCGFTATHEGFKRPL